MQKLATVQNTDIFEKTELGKSIIKNSPMGPWTSFESKSLIIDIVIMMLSTQVSNAGGIY